MTPSPSLARWQILAQGIVQGVGFRPFIYGLALRHELAGWVRNDAAGVTIEVEGPEAALAAFVAAIRAEAPPLSRLDAVAHHAVPPQGDRAFTIVASEGGQRTTLIAPDSATCDDCLRELFDPADRRYRYPFINCTNCGPRFTIVRDIPYDRPKTSMSGFPLCPACRAEYEDPLNRRFHAQPNACTVCGPHLAWQTSNNDFVFPIENPKSEIENPPDLIARAATALAAGAILAVKGLGGYHLACDANNAEAVQRLRQRKQREAKPFALMVRDLDTARVLCHVSEAEATLLTSRRRSIILLDRRVNVPLPDALAPGHATLGLMLPYTPLHHLLLHDVAATRPNGLAALVMTSGNLSDEPIAYLDAEARERLGDIADAFLMHDRPIVTRCDDSVMRVTGGNEQMLRRARGYAPEPLTLADAAPEPILAYGAHLKNTFCLVRERRAVLSHHIGDLDNLPTLLSFREGIEHLSRLFDIAPQVIAYDLHPDYIATKEALASPIERKMGVQHHHAHIASVIAEHGLSGPVIGIAADGTGYGEDGTIWGGEVMVADEVSYERVGHLAYVPLPGGEAAVREPWRVAASYLHLTYGPSFLDLDLPFTRALDRQRWAVLAQMIGRGVNAPLTSSMGRLFDAVAALIGGRQAVQYEGQAAIELEVIALPDQLPYPATIDGSAPFQLDVRPTLRAIVDDLQAGVPAPIIAGRFHATVAALLAEACVRVRGERGLTTVALSGGVFQNRLLLESLSQRLTANGFAAYTNQRVPPNDGGISFGQAAVAAARLRREGKD